MWISYSICLIYFHLVNFNFKGPVIFKVTVFLVSQSHSFISKRIRTIAGDSESISRKFTHFDRLLLFASLTRTMKRRRSSALVSFLSSSTLACFGAIIHKSPEASILYGLWKSTSLSHSRYNTPADPVRYLRCPARVFIYFRGVNERDAGYCAPPSVAGATSFLRSICRDAIFTGVYTGNL